MVLRLLLGAGADIEATNGVGRVCVGTGVPRAHTRPPLLPQSQTALIYAAEKGHTAVVQLLLYSGAQADVKTNVQWNTKTKVPIDWPPHSIYIVTVLLGSECAPYSCGSGSYRGGAAAGGGGGAVG